MGRPERNTDADPYIIGRRELIDLIALLNDATDRDPLVLKARATALEWLNTRGEGAIQWPLGSRVELWTGDKGQISHYVVGERARVLVKLDSPRPFVAAHGRFFLTHQFVETSTLTLKRQRTHE